MVLTAQRYRIRRRISQLRFLESALLQPVCEIGRRRIVALRDELLGGPVGEQRLDFRTVLVQLAFAGAFRPSDRQAGSPSRAKGFFRPRGDQPRSISAAIFPPKSRSKLSPKIGRRQIDDIYAVSTGYRKFYGGFGTFEPLGPTMAEDSTAQLATSQCVSQVFMPLESTLFVLPKAQICSFEPLTPVTYGRTWYDSNRAGLDSGCLEWVEQTKVAQGQVSRRRTSCAGSEAG